MLQQRRKGKGHNRGIREHLVRCDYFLPFVATWGRDDTRKTTSTALWCPSLMLFGFFLFFLFSLLLHLLPRAFFSVVLLLRRSWPPSSSAALVAQLHHHRPWPPAPHPLPPLALSSLPLLPPAPNPSSLAAMAECCSNSPFVTHVAPFSFLFEPL